MYDPVLDATFSLSNEEKDNPAWYLGQPVSPSRPRPPSPLLVNLVKLTRVSPRSGTQPGTRA